MSGGRRIHDESFSTARSAPASRGHSRTLAQAAFPALQLLKIRALKPGKGLEPILCSRLLPLLKICPKEDRLAISRPIHRADLHVLRLSRQHTQMPAVRSSDRELVATRLRVTRVSDPPAPRGPGDAHAITVQSKRVELLSAA